MRNMAATQAETSNWSTRRRPPRPRSVATASRARQRRSCGRSIAAGRLRLVERAEIERLDGLFEELLDGLVLAAARQRHERFLERAGAGSRAAQLVERAVRDQLAVIEDGHAVAQLLGHLEHLGREEHRA